MATFKLTLKRGQRAQHATVAAGSAIAGSDAVELNVDATNMSKGDLIGMLDTLKQQVLERGFPQAAA